MYIPHPPGALNNSTLRFHLIKRKTQNLQGAITRQGTSPDSGGKNRKFMQFLKKWRECPGGGVYHKAAAPEDE